MKDRVPKYPGRVTLVPVAGQENTFDMVRADEPTQSGDPLNKNTLLKDVTASLFGLPESAVPDDAFAWLGKFNLHWWQRKNIQFRYITNVAAEAAVVLCTSVRNGTVSYSDLIDFDETTGALSLHSPQTATVSYAGETDSGIAFLRGKYFKFNSKIYYASETASYYCDRYSSPGLYGIYAGEVIVTPLDVSDVDYVHSSDRNAYPDSGVSGGYEYSYLGVPFENAVTAPKIVTGSYTGTEKVASTGGYSKTLTFAEIPDMIFILGKNNTNGNMSFAFVTPVGGKGTQPNSTSVATGLQALSATTTANSITWSGMGEAVQTVRNHTYYYWAIFGGVAS